MIINFGRDTPDDWLERKLYTPYNYAGVVLMLLIDVLLFGPIGILIWLVQMIWIPFWAAGVINGVGHTWGYRNGDSKDYSTNMIPIGIIIGGEELHNNHHLEPANPKLSRRWFEFDIGYMWLSIFRFFRLAKIRTI
jgi:stearoyl-CoA desaturase (delta-9 desaturase)